MLLAAIELVAQGMHKVFSKFVAGESKQEPSAGYLHVKQHSTIRLMTEMVETFMAFLRMIVDQDIEERHWKKLHSLTCDLLKLSHQIHNPKFNFESDVLKIAVFGGQSTLSTLYFFQEDLYPNTKILEFLLVCGARVNCQDIRHSHTHITPQGRRAGFHTPPGPAVSQPHLDTGLVVLG